MGKEIIHNDWDALIAAYLSEELTSQEEKELHDWVNATPENKKHFQDMQEVWFASIHTDRADRFSSTDAYNRFLSRTGDIPVKTLSPGRKNNWRPFVYGAAAVILLLICSYLSYWQGKEQLTNQFADVVIEAPLGSRTKMYLPDGSLVWLNAGSKISYSQGFGVNERILSLTGEGYFEVTKNQELPFAVKTQELHVNVVGTKFNFRNYPDDEEAAVSLLEGKVWVNNIVKEENDISLSPSQKVFLNKKTGEVRLYNGKVSNTVEWTSGFLFFDEDLLTDIVKVLERNYNVKITFADDSLKSLRFYGNFERREYTIEEILDILTITNKLKYKIQGKKIELCAK